MIEERDSMEISMSIRQEFENSEDVDCFLDEFIEKIESLGMMCGGGSDPSTGLHSLVISFVDEVESKNDVIVNEKIRHLQQWILNHRFSPTIVLWKVYDESDDCLQSC